MPIRKGAIVLFANADLAKVRITEFQKRYPEQLNRYLGILEEFPEDHLGLLLLKPTTDGYFELLDGHHRFLSYVMAGRRNVLTVIIEERYINDPRREDPGFVEGVCAELAAQAGDDVRSASLSDLRAQEERRAAQVARQHAILYAWAQLSKEDRKTIANISAPLLVALDIFEDKKEDI